MRASKADGSQALDLQRDALLGTGIPAGQLYEDHASGKQDDRPGLEACLKALRSGDTLVAWKLDRLGRDLRHLVNLVHDLTGRGVRLKVLAGQGANLDTTTANGRLIFGIFAALAEFERELIIERTRAGLASARARGPQRWTAVQDDRSKATTRWANRGEISASFAPSSASLARRSIATWIREVHSGQMERGFSGEVGQKKNRMPDGPLQHDATVCSVAAANSDNWIIFQALRQGPRHALGRFDLRSRFRRVHCHQHRAGKHRCGPASAPAPQAAKGG